MPVDLLSLTTVAAVLIALAFGLLCYASLPKAILVYAIGGAFFSDILIRFSGSSEFSDGLRGIELLATILIGVWILKRSAGLVRRPIPTPFNTPLMLLIPVSFVSLVMGFVWYDPKASVENMKVMVSLGQIALLIWPIGTYLVVSSSITDVKWHRRIQSVIYVLALAAYPIPFAGGESSVPLWATGFAMTAAPLAFSELLGRHASPMRRIFLLAVALVPIIIGIQEHKAAWYIAGVVSLGIVAALRGRVLLLVTVPLLIVLSLLLSAILTPGQLPPVLGDMIASEINTSSIGGRAGRWALMMDALWIWSQHPVLGVGPGNMWPYMHVYSVVDTAHNQFVNVLLELGLVGLGCLLAFVISTVHTGLRLLSLSKVPYHRTFLIGWIGLFVGMAASGITGDVMLLSIRNDGLRMFSVAYLQWVMLGLAVSIARIEYHQRFDPQPQPEPVLA